MGKKQKNRAEGQNETPRPASTQPPGVSRQTAVTLSVVMLVIGFIGGTIFGVLKSPPMPEGCESHSDSPASAAAPPTQMLDALAAEAARNPDNAGIWTQLGNAYFDAHQFQKAIDAYERSLAIAPGNPNVITDLGVMYRRNKQSEKAVEMFDRAIAADPRHEMSRMNKGIVLLHDLNDEKGALEAWEGLLELNPLAAFANGQPLFEMVRHLKEGHEDEGGSGK